MERYAWFARVRPGMLDEYVRRHDAIWPEMTRMLDEAGIHNYTIWNEDDMLFGYYECESIAFASKVQRESIIDQKWSEYMKDVMYQEKDPITGAQPLMKQVFYHR